MSYRENVTFLSRGSRVFWRRMDWLATESWQSASWLDWLTVHDCRLRNPVHDCRLDFSVQLPCLTTTSVRCVSCALIVPSRSPQLHLPNQRPASGQRSSGRGSVHRNAIKTTRAASGPPLFSFLHVSLQF